MEVLMPKQDEGASTNTLGQPVLPPPLLPPPPPLLPPPPPLPPPPVLCAPPTSQVKSKFYKQVAENSDPSVGECEELKRMIRKQRERFGGHLKWVLYNQHIPSLIQEGPQCGLVALWMAGGMLGIKHEVTLDSIVQVATSRGFTIHGEMFSADNMSCLAEEVFGCCCELLTGGMEGANQERILSHLTAGLPVLIPYDEDFNHEPCQRRGHRAHWAVISGVLLGMQNGSFDPDPDTPGLFLPPPSPSALDTGHIEEIYFIAKQGKSYRYQLWESRGLSRSNSQLSHLDPKRSCDGNVYVLPAGGVQAGLCGKVLLLKHSSEQHRRECV
ncbi:actin maturation protease isoform 2-T2 [Leptodactylus fuscus]|uniref:actin maturation protease isoform X2 n=1 Tax=Leptodactylus fuscus TaxID=238119 RepID=UPI003F4F1357